MGGDVSVVSCTRCADRGLSVPAANRAPTPSIKLAGMSAQVGSSSFTDDTWAMGLSPKRYRQSRSSDLFYVGSVVLVAVALVVWALYG